MTDLKIICRTARNWNLRPASAVFQIGNNAGRQRRRHMNGIIYLIGLIVVIMFILSFLGLR